jgi:hypothetical protein
MVLGMSLGVFTLVHTVISLVAIALGFVVTYGIVTSNRMPTVTAWFLLLTIVTSASGYLFPVTGILPSHIVGAISLALLAVAVVALYNFKLHGIWRPVYVVTALLALWFNVFVLFIQLFVKFPAFAALAPKQTEPPFLAVQGATLAFFVVMIVLGLKRFRPAA